MDNEAQTPGAYTASTEVQATQEAKYRATQTEKMANDNCVQTYEEEFEPWVNFTRHLYKNTISM